MRVRVLRLLLEARKKKRKNKNLPFAHRRFCGNKRLFSFLFSRRPPPSSVAMATMTRPPPASGLPSSATTSLRADDAPFFFSCFSSWFLPGYRLAVFARPSPISFRGSVLREKRLAFPEKRVGVVRAHAGKDCGRCLSFGRLLGENCVLSDSHPLLDAAISNSDRFPFASCSVVGVFVSWQRLQKLTLSNQPKRLLRD